MRPDGAFQEGADGFAGRLGDLLHRLTLGAFELVGLPLLLSSQTASGLSPAALFAVPTFGGRVEIVAASALALVSTVMGVADLVFAAVVLVGPPQWGRGSSPILVGLFSAAGQRGRIAIFSVVSVAVAVPLFARDQNQRALVSLVRPLVRCDLPIDPGVWKALKNVQIEKRLLAMLVTPTGEDPQFELLGRIPISESRRGFVVSIDLEQATDCHLSDLEVFYRPERGEWLQEARASTPLECGRRMYHLPIPAGVAFDRLRIDPGGGAGTFLVHRLMVSAAE